MGAPHGAGRDNPHGSLNTMPFCPRCGASTTSSMSYCVACGESLAPATTMAPRPTASTSQAPGGAATGPPGMTRDPLVVVLLSVVTLGLYGLYYWWVVSREVDDYARPTAPSHNLMRIGTVLALVGGAVLIFTLVSFLGALFAGSMSSGTFDEPTDAEVLAALLSGIGFFLLGATMAFAGAICRLVAKYRIWQAIEDAERHRPHARPLSSGLMLALAILAWFLSGPGVVVSLILVWMTQDHLNRLWGPPST